MKLVYHVDHFDTASGSDDSVRNVVNLTFARLVAAFKILY